MKAVVVRQFGNPSVLRYEEIEAPLPGPGEVLIRVHAAGTNPVDAGRSRCPGCLGMSWPG